MKIKIFPPLAILEQGNRDNQEDFIYPLNGRATSGDHLFIVCDGMGGHEHGEVASQTFTMALAEYFDKHASGDEILPDKVLTDAIAYAYRKLDNMDNGNFKKMGTTLTLLYFHRGGVTAAHIGDSRIYHLRPGKRLLYVSRDHSLVFDLYQSGEISYGEMKTSLQKNVITRAVQPGEENRVKPDIIHITDVKPDDYFYMCSDGMLENMDNDDVFRLFSTRDSDNAKRDRIIEATRGNQDNHSAYIIHVQDVVTEPIDGRKTVNEETTARCNALNMKPVEKEAVIQKIEPVDDDATILSSSSSATRRKSSGKKKTLSWLWWAMLIAAIVAVAAWLSLYAFTGNRGHDDAQQSVEVTGVQEVRPIKPIPHHTQRQVSATRKRHSQATHDAGASQQEASSVATSPQEPITDNSGNED